MGADTSATMTRIFALAVVLFAVPALAQQGGPECLDPDCGAPKEEGGGGCGCGCGCGCSVWVAMTDDGRTLSYTDDADGDGKADQLDNCPFSSNRDQSDLDGDGVGNTCDNCADASNLTQLDTDGDGRGDSCDADVDGDGLANEVDNCAGVPNADQYRTNLSSTFGDVCNGDDDLDGIVDGQDNCPRIANPTQVLPADPSLCNVDVDGDNVGDNFDNCPGAQNPSQTDTDLDGIGDVCDLDRDNDGIMNGADNCQLVRNRGQADDDGDGVGDGCDPLFCMVINPAEPDNCLNPRLPFKVSGGGQIALKKGEKFRLPLFANRDGTAIQYQWTVVSRPPGSSAAIVNPKGSVSTSRHYQYAYLDGSVPSFTADADGDYVLQLSAKLVFPDRAYPEGSTSTSDLRLRAEPMAGPATCSVSAAGGSLLGLSLAALALVRRRRK
ncbi:MAG: thrombospondin type 3 repeat-containing protein [Myxococcaceae bacterium]|nr:thrombospondin type 3 repeat-containing protein [Myxococcaceae bacterium]